MFIVMDIHKPQSVGLWKNSEREGRDVDREQGLGWAAGSRRQCKSRRFQGTSVLK